MTGTPRDPTQRFTDRVAAYGAHRPGYPPLLIRSLLDAGDLRPGDAVADIGAGTGLLSRVFIDADCRVFGVEPNAAMRAEAARRMSGEARFQPLDGRAEMTTLPAASVALVAAGQAFHWFDPVKARAEFLRILDPRGRVLLVWNVRATGGGKFMREYEAFLLKHLRAGEQLGPRTPDEETLTMWFGRAPRRIVGCHRQVLDRAGLAGRALSSSYLPAPGDEGHDAMLADLEDLFAGHQVDGAVAMDYEMRAWVGHLA